jgi:[protein-PII] uridylyltransferase
VCQALTAGLDRAIDALVSPLPDDVAVVAIGGYGRRELSPFSDVDLMLLHGLADPSEMAAALFRPLWDAKLRVGHSVRTLKEAGAAAKERVDTHTTLLTSRLVAGDDDLFDRLMQQVKSATRARPLRRHLVSEERARRAATPYLLMATDVKVGRGGLRTIHGFEWERRREALIGRFSTDSAGEEDEARESLLQIRNALHAVTGRHHDVFSTDLREPAARWLGFDEFEAARGLVEALQSVDRLASRRWPEVVDDRRRGVWGRLIGSPPPLQTTSEPTSDDLRWILETGEQGRLAFERLWESGHLERVLPEWDTVRSLPQLAPFHDHPVAPHLWRTTHEMLSLIEGDDHYGRVATELADPETLLLSAFLHDIGKGHGGDHANVGADIARSFCRRMAIDPERSRLVEGAVRHHLLLPITATRRDLDDPAVIEEIAATVGDPDLLKVLYLLTVADSKATGPTMWTEWKGTLLRTLFVRCAARLEFDQPVEGGTTRAEVLAASGPGRISAMEEHLEAMSSEYLRSSTTEEVLWHLQLILGLDGMSDIGVMSAGPVESAVVVGRQQPGFRRQVAQAFAANGIDVLEARMLTRDDGVVVDSFKVRDDRTGDRVEENKWVFVRTDLESGLRGELDTGSKMAARAAAYETSGGDEPVVRGAIDPASGDLVMTVKCSDRVGRLAEILSVLNDCGLSIRLAKIDSREGEVIDTFHISSNSTIEDRGRIGDLEHRIAGAITP